MTHAEPTPRAKSQLPRKSYRKRPQPPHLRRAWSTVLLLLTAVPISAAEPSFRTLDFSPTAVSADGSVVVGARNAQAVRWTASSGTVPLGTLPGQATSHAF